MIKNKKKLFISLNSIEYCCLIKSIDFDLKNLKYLETSLENFKISKF